MKTPNEWRMELSGWKRKPILPDELWCRVTEADIYKIQNDAIQSARSAESERIIKGIEATNRMLRNAK